MRILYLSPRQAWPPINGAKLRDYHLARALGQAGELTWVFYHAATEAPTKLADLPFCREVHPLPLPKLYTAPKIVQGLTGRWSLPVVNYSSPAMMEVIGGLRGQKFDIVHVDCVQLAACAESLAGEFPGAKVFYNWHNIESELMWRYGQSPSGASWARRAYARHTAAKLERDEDRILATGNGHVVCSSREQELLWKRAPGRRIEVIENGVDATAFAGLGQFTPGQAGSAAARNRLVFVGSMSYHANADAAVWFTNQVWPQVHRRFPHWILSLVGSSPSAEVLALRQVAGVEVTGTVPDVRPYYREAVAAVVPLRVGGGTRLKILEALAAGVPVVSTAEGAEGLAVQPGKEYLLASQAHEWLPLLESLQEEGRAGELVAAGRELVESRYDWEAIGRKLASTYKQWLRA